jgi:class 3 adenylate cyclase
VIGPGDGYEIPPGHDARVVGDEPWDSVEFTSAHAFGLAPEELGERVLATVLFSDIVGSTAMVERLGDHAWARLLHEHNVRIRAAIDRFRGREIGSAGDGFMALFDGAAKAVRAGALMDPAVAELGLRVRVGLHTSEVEIVGGQARGVAVHAAARVAALAGPGEVLVSGTTRELLDGSGLSLESRGEHELKGLSGARAIFALRR